MELKKQPLNQIVRKGRAFTQVTLDDDCIVKDSKPDIVKMIHTKGIVSLEEVKVESRVVWVSGQLKFTVLYRSDSEGNKLETLSDSVSFRDKIYMDEVTEDDSVWLDPRVEDLSITVINSRKLAVRAVIGINAVCEKQVSEAIACSVQEGGGVLEKKEKRTLLDLCVSKKDILRTHTEMTLPGANPNIARIIYDNVDIRGLRDTCVGEEIQIRGTASVSVLYQSGEGQLEWYETETPFVGNVDCGQMGQQALYWVRVRPGETELNLVTDADQEPRNLSLDMNFDVQLCVWQEKEFELLSDIYSLKNSLLPKTENVCVWNLMVKNEAKQRLLQQMKLQGGQEKILQISSCEGKLEVDRVEIRENGLNVEGILMADILYTTVDDHFPVAHAMEQIPFSQKIEVQGLAEGEKDIVYELEPEIDQLAVNLLDSEQYEIKAVLSLTALVLREEHFDTIAEIQEEPLDVEKLSSLPGITGYVVQKDESLWDIAKRYHTTEEEMMRTNGLTGGQISPGQKLVIVKSVV